MASGHGSSVSSVYYIYICIYFYKSFDMRSKVMLT